MTKFDTLKVSSYSTQVGRLYGTNAKLGVKKGVNLPKKVRNSLFIGVFTRKPMQIIYFLVAIKQADYMVQIRNQLGVKKGAKSLILGSLMIFI